MSFNFNNVNIPHTPTPQIKKTGDGHAGNSGYCPQQKKEEKSKEDEMDKFDSSIFDDEDTSEFLDSLDENENSNNGILNKFKNFFK